MDSTAELGHMIGGAIAGVVVAYVVIVLLMIFFLRLLRSWFPGFIGYGDDAYTSWSGTDWFDSGSDDSFAGGGGDFGGGGSSGEW